MGQEAVLKATSRHKEGRTLDQIYKQYQARTKTPMLRSSVLAALTKLIVKGCVERLSRGHYRATGKAYYSNKGKKQPESVYIVAIRRYGGAGVPAAKILRFVHKEADKYNTRRKTSQKKRAKPELISALVYLDRLKAQGRVIQDAESHFGLPEMVADPEGEGGE